MQTQPDVQQIITRTRQYEFADGLRDMQFGLMWLAYGVMIWFEFDMAGLWFPLLVQLRRQFGPLAALSSIVIPLIPALLVLAALGLMNVVRRRWLWRNLGQVKASRIIVTRRVSVISVIILLAGVGIAYGLAQLGLVDGDATLRALFAASGVSFGYTMAAMGADLHLARYMAVGWAGGLVSLIVLALPVSLGVFALTLGIGWALILGVAGMPPLLDALRAASDVNGAGDDRRD